MVGMRPDRRFGLAPCFNFGPIRQPKFLTFLNIGVGQVTNAHVAA